MAARTIRLLSLRQPVRSTTSNVFIHSSFVSASSRSLHISQRKFQQSPSTPHKALPNVEDVARKENQAPDIRTRGIFSRVAAKLREKLPNTTEPYVAHGVTLELYNECLKQADYVDGQELSESARFWYDVCGRPKTFMSWAQVTVLHMWMLIVRIRAFEPDNVKVWQQNFVDHFFYDAEGKMINTYKIGSAGERKTYLKDLYSQYRGMIAGFDEGLCRGDAVLAAAIWRNVFDANPEIDMEVLAMVTSYTRRVVSSLDKLDDGVLYAAGVTFGHPEEEAETVRKKCNYLEKLAKGGDVDIKKT